MRILEPSFLILILAVLIGSYKREAAKSLAFSILSGCAFLVLMLHLMIEGWRWQMTPAYGVGAVILAVVAMRKLLKRDAESRPRSKLRTGLKILLSGTGVLLLFVSGVLSWALPVFQLPSPTGPYQVGTSQWYLLDNSREETHTAKPGDLREISVWGWYPANASGMNKTAGYFQNAKLIGKAIIASPSASGKLGLTWLREAGAGFLFDYLRLVRTHAYPNAAVSKKQAPYPVLIFSHGYGAHATQNTALMEELASHGYAVFSIGHTYESLMELFPDGRQIRYSPKDNLDAGLSELRKSAEDIKADDLAASIALFKKFNTPALNSSISVWSADTRFVIDWLETTNTKDPMSPFYQGLDLTKLGVFGMSLGGLTACQVMYEDRRVKAAINMDGGSPMGDLIYRSLDIPVMFMNSEPSTALQVVNQTLIEYMTGRSDTAVYNLTVIGSKHNNFMDLSVWSPALKYSGLLGNINGDKMLRIMNAYIIAFFDKHLRRIDSPLLNGPSPDFPEVILNR